MISWNEAYARCLESESFKLSFGKRFRQDDFRYYAYGLRFESVRPALISNGTTINTGDLAITAANMAAPQFNVVPGEPSTLDIAFPAGAVIIGIMAAATSPQKILLPGAVSHTYATYEGSRSKGAQFNIRLQGSDSENITAGNPIDEVVSSPNAAIRSIPFAAAEALVGDGICSEEPTDPLVVTPGLSLTVSVQSMSLASNMTGMGAGGTLPLPSQSVHVVFHCMIPGTVTIAKPATA